MIQNFNQFLNESVNGKHLSVHEEINKPFSDFIDKAQERLNLFKYRFETLLHDMDIAIETVQEELSDIIVSEPIIKVDNDLFEITVDFHTNIINADDDNLDITEEDENAYLDLEKKLTYLLDKRSEAHARIFYKSNEQGNCIIRLSLHVLNEDNFGEYTKVLRMLGEDYI